jgi:hypothetical protein
MGWWSIHATRVTASAAVLLKFDQLAVAGQLPDRVEVLAEKLHDRGRHERLSAGVIGQRQVQACLDLARRARLQADLTAFFVMVDDIGTAT